MDLLIQSEQVICAANNLAGPASIRISDGIITDVTPGLPEAAEPSLKFLDALVLPGLIDLHAHPACQGSVWGVHPDQQMLSTGVTTVMSQGDAGSSNWARYRNNIIHGSKTRVRLAINLSAPGETNPMRCFERPEDIDVEACVSIVEEADDLIWGVAVNTSLASCGEFDPRKILKRGLEVAERTNRPLLFGSRLHTDVPLEEQLSLLRPGDVMTYCFNAKDENLVKDGRIRDCVHEARERGILFDIGHGMASFSFETAEAAIGQAFLPDTISTDQYVLHVGSDPQHDLPRTMSKLIALGMSESDAFVRVTLYPARVLGLTGEVGTLAPGSCADLCILRWNDRAAVLRDVNGNERPGGCWEPVDTIRAGRPVSRM